MVGGEERPPEGSETVESQAPRSPESNVARRAGAAVEQRVVALEHELLEARGRIAQAVAQNERLSRTLREAREQITGLRDEISALSAPPNPYGVVVERNADGTLDVASAGRKLRVRVDPMLDIDGIGVGDEVASTRPKR